MAQRSVAVFDLGGVVIDWNPRYLYCKLFDGNDRAMEDFLATVCTRRGTNCKLVGEHLRMLAIPLR